MERDNTDNLKFAVTMKYAYDMLEQGSITPEEYKKFLDEMYEKYRVEEVRVCYQAKLDCFLYMKPEIKEQANDK